MKNLFPAEEAESPFHNSDHPYAADLDIFGHRGLFHLINRSATQAGRKQLAAWLTGRASKSEIRGRQEAVGELVDMVDHRQLIQVSGHRIDDAAPQFSSLFGLHKQPYHFIDRKLLKFLMSVSPLLTTGLCVGVFFGVSYLFPVGLMTFHAIYINRQKRRISETYRIIFRSSKILKAYHRILLAIEKQPYESQKLRNLQASLSTAGHTWASTAIKRLVTITEWAELRSNPALHFMFNYLFLWDLHLALRLEKWRRENDTRIRAWFRAMGELEALCSFANLHFNNPGWVFPTIAATSVDFRAKGMGHPLIPPSERVCNDFKLTAQTPIAVVTGPNMAGKSTFLKTIGVNLVLALAGSPVCAETGSFPCVKIYSSMKASDSLHKHFSLFYAELQRLKKIIDGISKREPVFFLIDEMLKGTNIKDRQMGSKALLTQLLGAGVAGVIATHDMELTDPLKHVSQRDTRLNGILNLHFDGFIKGEKLIFDYKLKPGICDSFNATILMKRAGIRIPD
jgi:DNA mismatch repair ATPase MutS